MVFLGIDIGTTNTKALLADEKGRILSKGQRGYPLLTRGVRIEQNPEDWIGAVTAAVGDAVLRAGGAGGEIAAIALSAQGASTVALDGAFRPVGNALTWMDRRAEPEAEELREKLSDDYFYQTTGWRLNPSLDAAKILHMERNAGGARMYCSTMEYVHHFLTGNPCIDPCGAAIRQLYAIRENRWDQAILEAIGIGEEKLPAVVNTGDFVGALRKDAARLLSLREGIPVFCGAHDQYCASVGAGAVRKGDMLLSCGTTWVLMGISAQPMFTASYLSPAKHPAGGLYGNIASLVGSGACMEWFRENFTRDGYETLDRIAKERRERTKGLHFFPYLSGAGYPLWKDALRGGFAGVELGHDRYDFARCVMEGVVFNLRLALEDFGRNGFGAGRIRLVGGAAKSELWSEMICEISGAPIEKMAESDSAALGAAMIAAVGAKAFDGFSAAAKAMVKSEMMLEPERDAAAYYDEKYRMFRELLERIS